MFEGIGEVRQVVLYGDPRLKVVCRAAEIGSEECDSTIAELVITHTKLNGFGLAAPQIGRDLRIMVVHDDSMAGRVRVCVNPEILSQSGEQIVPEGCFSLPGVRASIKRPNEIVLRYTNVDGRVLEMDAEGVAAAVLCHEVDHLDGKTILDHVSKERRKRLVRQFQKHRQELFKRKMGRARGS